MFLDTSPPENIPNLVFLVLILFSSGSGCMYFIGLTHNFSVENIHKNSSEQVMMGLGNSTPNNSSL